MTERCDIKIKPRNLDAKKLWYTVYQQDYFPYGKKN